MDMTHPAHDGYFVYRATAPDGCVIYIGYTARPARRMARHRSSKAPWTLVDGALTWEEFSTETAARKAESRYIRELQPEWNVLENIGAPSFAECPHPTPEEAAEILESRIIRAVFDG